MELWSVGMRDWSDNDENDNKVMSEVISVDVINSIPPTLYTSKQGELEIQSNTTNSIDLTNKNLNF